MLRETELTDNPGYHDRRLNDRSRLIVQIYFSGADATGVAHTRDISLGGLYMNTQQNFTEGDLITVRIPLSSGYVTVGGQVVYSNPGHGVGVRFVKMSQEDRARLEEELPLP